MAVEGGGEACTRYGAEQPHWWQDGWAAAWAAGVATA